MIRPQPTSMQSVNHSTSDTDRASNAPLVSTRSLLLSFVTASVWTSGEPQSLPPLHESKFIDRVEVGTTKWAGYRPSEHATVAIQSKRNAAESATTVVANVVKDSDHNVKLKDLCEELEEGHGTDALTIQRKPVILSLHLSSTPTTLPLPRQNALSPNQTFLAP